MDSRPLAVKTHHFLFLMDSLSTAGRYCADDLGCYGVPALQKLPQEGQEPSRSNKRCDKPHNRGDAVRSLYHG